jgi:hypothetical protein
METMTTVDGVTSPSEGSGQGSGANGSHPENHGGTVSGVAHGTSAQGCEKGHEVAATASGNELRPCKNTSTTVGNGSTTTTSVAPGNGAGIGNGSGNAGGTSQSHGKDDAAPKGDGNNNGNGRQIGPRTTD